MNPTIKDAEHAAHLRDTAKSNAKATLVQYFDLFADLSGTHLTVAMHKRIGQAIEGAIDDIVDASVAATALMAIKLPDPAIHLGGSHRTFMEEMGKDPWPVDKHVRDLTRDAESWRQVRDEFLRLDTRSDSTADTPNRIGDCDIVSVLFRIMHSAVSKTRPYTKLTQADGRVEIRYESGRVGLHHDKEREDEEPIEPETPKMPVLYRGSDGQWQYMDGNIETDAAGSKWQLVDFGDSGAYTVIHGDETEEELLAMGFVIDSDLHCPLCDENDAEDYPGDGTFTADHDGDDAVKEEVDKITSAVLPLPEVEPVATILCNEKPVKHETPLTISGLEKKLKIVGHDIPYHDEVHVEATDEHTPRRGARQRGQDADQRRLAGSVRPEEGQKVTFIDP